MSDLKVSEAHLQELRKVHSMLHASMDALIRDMNANEAARLLILLDDRLTSLINAAAELEPKPDRKRPDRPFAGVPPTMGDIRPADAAAERPLARPVAPVAMPATIASAPGEAVSDETAASDAEVSVDAKRGAPAAAGAAPSDQLRESQTTSSAQPPATPKPPVFEPLSAKPVPPRATALANPPPVGEPAPKAAEPSEPEGLVDSGPILFVPPPPPPKPVAPAARSVASAGPSEPAKPTTAETRPASDAPPVSVKPEAVPPAPPASSKAVSTSALSAPPIAASAAIASSTPETARPLPPIAPLTEPTETLEEEGDASDKEDWVEEDFEDGEDLEEEAEAAKADDPFEDETVEVAEPPVDEASAKPASGGGLFGGGLFSKLKLPGFGRRKAEEKAPQRDAADGEPHDLQDDLDDEFEDDLDEDLIEDEDEPAASDHAIGIGRLHAVVDQLAADNLLDEALRRTGNRIELRKVEEGLDIVVKGLPAALGTVRLDETDGHVLYQPRFGLDLPEREPNRADLELWLKAMGDVVVHVLADIAQRRSKPSAPDTEPAA